MGIRNMINYRKQAYQKKGLFVYQGTAALKKGYGMCFDLGYLTTETGEKAADPFGARGLKVVEEPSFVNANAFAGVLTQNYPARTSGLQLVELALPGGCAMIAQRVISSINTGLVTCIVDTVAGGGLSGLFGYGGLSGRGSAIPLQTLAAATKGDLAIANVTGTATAAYDSGTGLTTVTLAGAGTALGYAADPAFAASDYELTVLGGAPAATGHATVGRAVQGVYPVVAATGVNTFTVTGNTGHTADMTTFLTKKNLLKLAYLCDGLESGLSEYVTPKVSAASQFILLRGMTFICGGLTMTGDSSAILADNTAEGSKDGDRKAFYALGTNVDHSYLISIAGLKVTGVALANIDFLTSGEFSVLVWHGNYGTGTAGMWRVLDGTAVEG